MRVARRLALQCVALLSFAVLATHCGSSDDGAAAVAPEAGVDTGGGGAGSGLVTPSAGGTVVSADGRVTVIVPPGAVAEDTTITIAPSASYPVDTQVVTGAVYDFGPNRIVFLKPVTLSIAYSASAIPIGVSEADLRVQKVYGSFWGPVNDGTIDVEADVVRAEVLGFSIYGVRSLLAPSDGDAGTDAGSDADTDADADADAGPSPPPVGDLVAAGGFTTALAGVRVEGSYVYWSGFSLGTGAGIKRIPMAGGAIEDVISAHPRPIFGAAFTGGKLFFSDDDSVIYSVNPAGGTLALHAANSFASDGDLTTDDTHLYWAGNDNGNDAVIARTSATGSSCQARLRTAVTCAQAPACDPGERKMACVDQGADAELTCCGVLETFALRRSPDFPLSRARRIVLDGGYAYWTENSTEKAWVLRKAIAGGAVEEIASEVVQNNNANTFQTLAVAGGRVFWVRALAGGGLFSAPVTGGTAKKEVAGGFQQVRADATNVYFSGAREVSSAVFDEGVYRMPAAGTTIAHIASGSSGGTSDLALNGTHAYYLDGTSIRRVVK